VTGKKALKTDTHSSTRVPVNNELD